VPRSGLGHDRLSDGGHPCVGAALVSTSRRATWARGVSSHQFTAGMRPVKATLLSLPMDPEGRVSAWRSELTDATGVPAGTLKRHLARAVKAGWLIHETHGGHGRRGTYRATFPDL
jgi:hypothetical protein